MKPSKQSSRTALWCRRDFLIGVAASSAALTLPRTGVAGKAPPHQLPPLPYPEQALAPILSAQTVGFHYGKHHKGYVEKLNQLLVGDPLADLPLEALIRAVAGKQDRAAVFNNAAQVWNHTFYWNSLRPQGGAPTGRLKERIEADFGGMEKLRLELLQAATGQFGSGWVWLVLDDGKLKVQKTANAETPMAQGKLCLLALDVWEHAYYLDYQNRRADYAAVVIDKLLNWDAAAQRLDSAVPAPKR